MNFSRSNLIEHFDDIKNQIDIKCEQSLQETEESKRPQIESIRTKFMDEINETFKNNLNKFESTESLEQVDLFDWKFCFYTPSNMKFTPCGILVLTNQYVNNQIQSMIKHEYLNDLTIDSIQNLTTKEALLGAALSSLIESVIDSQKPGELINLRDNSKNRIETIYITRFIINSITLDDFKVLDKIMDKKCLKEAIFVLDVPRLENGLFSFFDQITLLELTLNVPCLLKPGCFNGLVNLRKLFFHNLSTESIDENIFIGMNKLELLIIKESRLEFLGDCVFSSLPKIETLSLVKSSLKRIGSKTFKDLNGLKYLEMRQNEFLCLPLNALNDLNSLVALNMHNTMGIQIDAKMFNCLNNLEFLSLFQTNKSETVVNLDKLSLVNLKYLAISSKKVPSFDLNIEFLFINGIDRLNENSFNTLLGLKGLIIDSHGAYFNDFKKEVFAKMDNLKYLTIKFDRLNAQEIHFCRNNQELFKSFLKSHRVNYDLSAERGYYLTMSSYDDLFDFMNNELNVHKITNQAIQENYESFIYD